MSTAVPAAPAPTNPPPTASRPTGSPASIPRGELRDQGAVRRDSVAIERWTARGLVKVTGEARFGEGTLDGTITIAGALSAESVQLRGSLDLGGPGEVRHRFVGSGSLRTAAAFHAGEADLKGTVRTGGALSVDRLLKLRGTLDAPSLAVGALDFSGDAEVPGTTTGGSISAHLLASSAFGPIRAKNVSLRAKIPNLVERILSRDVEVSVDQIEAETVYLEAVDVEFVRAPKISLGRNAHITQYEGTIVRRHPSSRVGFESRSPPPYGLSR